MTILNVVLIRVFMPVARLAIGRGLGFRDVVDPLKRAFLLVAEEAPGKLTDSRLAVLSGLQRRDVLRLRGGADTRRATSAPARLIALWQDHPSTLPRKGAVSFEELARAVSQDTHPRTLLDLLEAAGSVRIEGDQVIRITDAYLPGAGSDEQLAYLADNLSDHGKAAVANVLEEARHFDRAAHYAGLTEKDAQKLEKMFSQGQMKLLKDIDRAARSFEADGTHRVRFGGYSYTEKDET